MQVRPLVYGAAIGLLPSLATSFARDARAGAPEGGPTEPGIHVTLPWLATQLLPSPEIAMGEGGALFGVRWQVTPLLFSWGIHRGLSPWRFFIAEPYVRQSGSVELFFTPEWIDTGSATSGWIPRTGVRSYFPIIEHGEYLSVSLGASHFVYGGQSGAALEAGVYMLAGVLGLQLTVSPTQTVSPLATIATLRVRVF